MKTVYRGMRIRSEEEAKSLLEFGMSYYWENSENAVHDIFRALERFHKMRKLGYSPLIRSHLLEACRPNRLQIWGTGDKNNANSYARCSPELMYLLLDQICDTRKQVMNYLNERFGLPYVVTFTVDQPDDGRIHINETYGRFIEPERIQSVELVDITRPDPHLALFRDEKLDPRYEMVVCRN